MKPENELMGKVEDEKIITKRDIKKAKTIDSNYNIKNFIMDKDELFYTNGYNYPVPIRVIKKVY